MLPPADDDTLVASLTAESAAEIPALIAGRSQIVRWLGGILGVWGHGRG